jgi:hypothetical protein
MSGGAPSDPSEEDDFVPPGWLEAGDVFVPPKPTTMPYEMTNEEWVAYYIRHCKEDGMVPALPVGDRGHWWEHAMECASRNAPRYLYRYFKWKHLAPPPEPPEPPVAVAQAGPPPAGGQQPLRSKLRAAASGLLNRRLLRSGLGQGRAPVKPKPPVSSTPRGGSKPAAGSFRYNVRNALGRFTPLAGPGPSGVAADPRPVPTEAPVRRPVTRQFTAVGASGKFMKMRPLDILGNQRRLRELRAWARARRSDP